MPAARRTSPSAKELAERIEALEEQLSEVIAENRELETAVERLTRIIEGDPDLNVPQMRALIAKQAAELERVQNILDRVKWVGLALGTINGGQLLVTLANLFGLGR